LAGTPKTGLGTLPTPGEGRIAVVAGSGELPVVLARNLEHANVAPPLIVLVKDEADKSLKSFDNIEMPLEHVATLPSRLRSAGVTHVVFGGGISRRPSLRAIKPSMALFKFAFTLVGALSRGDDKLLRLLIRAAESEGLTVLGAHEIVPDILTGQGLLSRARPNKTDKRDIVSACSALQLIGSLDLGQAAVSVAGRVVAIEGPEGTDAMLKRIADLRASRRLPAKAGGVLVKCAKPDQELRIDLPSIGPDTVANAKAARLRGIAVEAGKSIILDREKTISAADESGLFLFGIGSESR
jgi:hypothetical protein